MTVETGTLQILRHQTGNALVIGTAPLKVGAGGILPGQLVMDEVADILYIGAGNDGAGNSTTILPLGGAGAFLKAALLGVANGIAPTDATNKIPLAFLPASVVGGLDYVGTWNASTNTPALASGTGTKGNFYKVSVAGTTTLDGNSNWNVGDSLHFDGTTWDKLDGPAEAVVSVLGQIGAITLAQLVAGGVAPSNGPTLVNPIVGTQAAGDSSTKAASTAFVAGAVAAGVAAVTYTGIDNGVI